ncbi:MAG: Bug family tripartite tricarboxylate transporter substrate binding protein [Burkholderiales bacterium]
MKYRYIWMGLLAVVSAISTQVLAAEAYPQRPIRFIVPYSVGGTSDLIGRLLGAKLTEVLGTQLVVDNRGGAGSTLGTALAAQANPDGYTIILNNIGLAVNETLRPKRAYVALRDLAPISLAGFASSVLVVNNNLPARNIKEFVALAKKEPGKIAFGSAGAGSSTHLSMAYFQSVAGIKLLHVPYKGGGPAVRDAIAGNVQCVMAPIPTVFGHLKAGRLRGLALSGRNRSPVLPDMPTIAESGVPGYHFSTWYGVLVQAKTPKAVIARLNEAVVKSLGPGETRDKLQAAGLDPQSSTPEVFRKLIQSETAKWRKVIESAGITR